MGRRVSPVGRSGLARFVFGLPMTRARHFAGSAIFALAICFHLPFFSVGASAQTAAQQESAGDQPRMVVEAKELVQDPAKNTVTATGDVQIYYKGKTLEADRVVYDKNTSRVYAEGHAKLTEANGEVSYADHFDLTDDLKQGFIDGLRSETTEKTYLSSPRAELTGVTRVYDRATYTACKPCENDEHPPLWRIRATRVISKTDEQNLYFENARLEFLGIPTVYLPYFSIPSPEVKRRSGILSPHYVYKSQLGYGFGLPIFYNFAPNIDMVFTPTFLTKQGVLLEGEYKQRFDNGSFGVRADGIRQLNPGAFANPPYGASDRTFRGSVSTAGEFAINDKWKFGWDGAWLSDRFFFQDYQVYNPLYNSLFFREVSSTAYLTGKGEQSWFDLRGFAFQGLSPRDYQPQIANPVPILDYNRVFPLPPEKSMGLGGQVELDFNAMYTHEQAALFDPINPRTLDSIYAANYVCQFYTPGLTPQSSQCLLRGIGGDYARATAQGSWQRRYIDPIGETWTPFAFVRGSSSYLAYNTTDSFNVVSASGQNLTNATQGLFVGANDVARANVIPGVGLEYRYPFFTTLPVGSMTFEPIGQIVVRPDRVVGSNSMVNIDSQSLVFDDSTLFAWNKFSGYDRFETGTRVNYGGQFTLNFKNGGFINAMAGQSYQLAGTNSYATPDAANVGLSSGLDTRRSDYVGRLAIAPNSVFSLVAKGRFDVDSFRLRRIDLVAGATLGSLTLTGQYANYDSQPLIGFDKRRQGLSFGGKYDITSNYYLTANMTFDLSRHLYNTPSGAASLFYNSVTGQVFSLAAPTPTVGSAPVLSIAGLNLGAGYHDDCTTFTVNYSSVYQPNSLGQAARNQTFLVGLTLRTLGQAKVGASLGSTALNDGIKTLP